MIKVKNLNITNKNRKGQFEKGNIPWINGKHHSEKSKKKISETRKKRFKSGELISPMKNKKHSEETKEKISKTRKKLFKEGELISFNKGKKHTEETIIRMKKSHIGAIPWNKGKKGVQKCSDKTKVKRSESMKNFILNNINKHYKDNHETGYFYSIKNNKNIWYRSSYELIAYQLLEKMTEVISYKTEPFNIQYKYNNILKNYVPDILIEYKNGKKELIEIKPQRLLDNKLNKLKMENAKIFCNENNILFNIWTEDNLNVKNRDN